MVNRWGKCGNSDRFYFGRLQNHCISDCSHKIKIMAPSYITSWQIDGETKETVTDFIFFSSRITADGDCSHEIKMLVPWKKKLWQTCVALCLCLIMSDSLKTTQLIKKQRHNFADKCPSSQSYGFSSSHVWMCKLDHKESWDQRIDAFEWWC